MPRPGKSHLNTFGTSRRRPSHFQAKPLPSNSRLTRRKVQAHVSDSGRLEELLFSGNKVMIRKVDLSPTSKPSKRKTEYDLVLAASDDIWVCIDTRYPNDIFEMAVKGNVLQDFCGYEEVKEKSPWTESSMK